MGRRITFGATLMLAGLVGEPSAHAQAVSAAPDDGGGGVVSVGAGKSRVPAG